jgi:plasmid stabilization system protein ParE
VTENTDNAILSVEGLSRDFRGATTFGSNIKSAKGWDMYGLCARKLESYIAEDNIDAADLHQEKLHQRWLPLIDQSRMGRKRDEIRPELRSITEGDYIIYYQIVRDGVLIGSANTPWLKRSQASIFRAREIGRLVTNQELQQCHLSSGIAWMYGVLYSNPNISALECKAALRFVLDRIFCLQGM